jgi:hypothetical protein
MASLDELMSGKKSVIVEAAQKYLSEILIERVCELRVYQDLLKSEIRDRENILSEVNDQLICAERLEQALKDELRYWQ